MRAGIYWGGRDAADAVQRIVEAEAAGVPLAWHGHGGAFPDPLTFLAAAAARTSSIQLATGIVQVHNRTPAVVATQAAAIGQLAPGRFRLGIGWDRALPHPLTYMRAFIRELRPLLDPTGISLLFATIGLNSFRLAGECADGAVTWLVEPAVVARALRNELQSGADRAGRPVPPVVLHMNVCFADGFEAAAAAIRSSPLGRMRQDGWPDETVEALAVWGDDQEVRQRLQYALDVSRAAELMLRPVFSNPREPGDEGERFLRLAAWLNQPG